MFDLERAIQERHSMWKFLVRPVPRDVFEEALALAQQAPSNSNIQPWHIVFAVGAARDRMKEALLAETRRRPNIPPLPPAFQYYRQEAGARPGSFEMTFRAARRSHRDDGARTSNDSRKYFQQEGVM
jgi:nitroreductase